MASTKNASNEPTTIAEWRQRHAELSESGKAHPNEIEHARKMSLGGHPDYRGGPHATGGSRGDDEGTAERKPSSVTVK